MLKSGTPRVNFTNILQAAFVPISFCQKNTNQSCKYKKAACKMLMKLTPEVDFRSESQEKDGRRSAALPLVTPLKKYTIYIYFVFTFSNYIALINNIIQTIIRMVPLFWQYFFIQGFSFMFDPKTSSNNEI